MKRPLLWIPLALFALVAVVAAVGLLRPSDSTIPSRLVGKALPDFALAPATPGKAGLASGDMRGGGVRLLNIFASWCVPCIAEAPVLMDLKRRGVAIDGVALRDKPADVARFLDRNGDPFARIGADPDSRVQFALGSAGVPESFVIDARGVIRHQHIGAIRPEDVPGILRAIEAAR